jgi:outer membrane protein
MSKTKTVVSSPLVSQRSNYLVLIYNVLISIALIFLLFNYFLKNDKIAYVDSARILNEYKGSAEAKKAFQTKAQIWQANIDTLTNEVKKSIGDYEKSLAVMSPKEQLLSKQLIQSKEQQLSDYQKATQEKAKQEDGKLTQGIVAQINGFLTSYGKKHNYKLILIANQSGTIAYARDGLDITTEVITELNNEYAEKQ